MSPIKSLIAVLFALGSAGALAQDQAAPAATPPTPTPTPTPTPVLGGASYGPVLDPRPPTRATTERPTRASTRAIGERPTEASTERPARVIGETRPQAQEERAGEAPLTGWEPEVDPSARPAPVPAAGSVKPSTRQEPRTQQEQRGVPERQRQPEKQAGQHPRRPGAVQRTEATPRIAAPAPAPAARVPLPPAPGQVGPQSSQAVGCVGGSCSDASGARYNAGGGGNVLLSNDGRLCTSNGANIQCL